MDERELANFVLRAIDEAAYRNAVAQVTAVRIAIGGRRVFNLDELGRTFSAVTRGTVAEGARLKVEINPVQHHCRACGANFQAGRGDCACPACGHPHTEPVGGEEIRVLAIEAA